MDLVVKDTAAIRNRYENSACTDGIPRTMIYNGLIIRGTNCKDKTFEKFTDYIKDNIVEKLNAHKYVPEFQRYTGVSEIYRNSRDIQE